MYRFASKKKYRQKFPLLDFPLEGIRFIEVEHFISVEMFPFPLLSSSPIC